MSRSFDAIIIGAGQAGPSLAGRLTATGMKVALIERKLVGGTCVNTGCMPTKAMVASAYAAHLARRAARLRRLIGGGIVDRHEAGARARGQGTRDARAGLESWLTGMENFTLIRGHARFTGPHTVEVDGDTLDGAAASSSMSAAGPQCRTCPASTMSTCLDNTDMVALEEVPRHLVVVGGSYIGLEFAQMFRRFGAEVTVVEEGRA